MGLDIPDVRLVVHWQHPSSIEDYLQEFGRAGRDGKQSLAVLFTQEHSGSKTDTGLLEFMAKHSIANAAVTDDVRDELLKNKISDIAELAELCFRRECFRKAIKSRFVTPAATHKKTLARRIIEWVFLKKEPTRKSAWCCDYCDSVSEINYQEWAKMLFSFDTRL
jgi:superfamily II DNA helicase RecQ